VRSCNYCDCFLGELVALSNSIRFNYVVGIERLYSDVVCDVQLVLNELDDSMRGSACVYSRYIPPSPLVT